MEFILETKNNVDIMRLKSARLDSDVAPQLKTQLLVLMQEGENHLLLDFKDVEYCDSSGLGALLLGLREANDCGKQLKLVNINPRVLSLIRIAKLDHVIEAYDNEKEALKSFEETEDK